MTGKIRWIVLSFCLLLPFLALTVAGLTLGADRVARMMDILVKVAVTR